MSNRLTSRICAAGGAVYVVFSLIGSNQENAEPTQTSSTVSHSSPVPRAVLPGRLFADWRAGRDRWVPLAIAAVVLLGDRKSVV